MSEYNIIMPKDLSLFCYVSVSYKYAQEYLFFCIVSIYIYA